MMDQGVRSDVLSPIEVENYAQNIEPSVPEELGSLRWLEKHDRIERLTMQAIVQALSNREETVKEMLITYEKLPILVHDLILIEVWRELVLGKLLKEKVQCSFSIHTILHHEATCINLIETVLYHPEAVETLGDAVLDLTDYCFHTLNNLVAIGPPKKSSSDSEGMTSDLKSQAREVRFKAAFKALSCLRYIIEQCHNAAGEVVPRLVITWDTPMLLASLILQKPWQRRTEQGEEEEYNGDEQKWTPIRPQDRLLIGKVEAQAWLGLYQILLNERVISMYDLTDFRKDQLLRLRPLLHEVVVDQIPVLNAFTNWLDTIAIGYQAPQSKAPLIIEMVSSIRPKIESDFKRNMKSLMETYKAELVSPSRDLMMAKAQKLSQTYDFENLEAVLPPSKCVVCGDPASKRCSRCRNEWYCSRKCQVGHWTKHKTICDLIAS